MYELVSAAVSAEFFFASRCECVMNELERVSTYGPPTVPAVVILAVDRPDLATHKHTDIHTYIQTDSLRQTLKTPLQWRSQGGEAVAAVAPPPRRTGQ